MRLGGGDFLGKCGRGDKAFLQQIPLPDVVTTQPRNGYMETLGYDDPGNLAITFIIICCELRRRADIVGQFLSFGHRTP